MTTYCRLDPANRRLEIGYTWYRQNCQRTALNTECKLMLLRHAFEALNCASVEFRTSAFNFTSRKAIERLGAKLDGVLRNTRIFANGAIGDSYVYSILNNEWPIVKTNLEYKLRR
jgi:RimJ/RimL family protein N-acetyltransferase